MIVDIEIAGEGLEKIYFLSAHIGNVSLPLWLASDMSLTRVQTKRAYVRTFEKAQKLAALILSGKIKEGVAYKGDAK